MALSKTEWVFRAISVIASGTTSLTIAKPTGTVDGDIMVMALSHKGAGFATVPAGWNLIDQDISGAIRGEAYWKRASGEGASYSVTGLADTACGFIKSFSGGLSSGSVVHLVAKNIVSAGTNPPIPNPPIGIDGALILAFGAFSTNVAVVSLTNTNADAFYSLDPGLPWAGPSGATANGTGSGVALFDALKISAGSIIDGGVLEFLINTSPTAVTMLIALIPQADTISTTTKFYGGTGSPNALVQGEFQGTWNAGVSDRDNRGVQWPTFELSPIRTWKGEESQAFQTIATGHGAGTPYDGIFGLRYVTPPLAAGTSSGTVQLNWAIFELLDADLLSAKLKIHIYVCRNNNLSDVVGTLLDNYVNPTNLTTAVIWISLASAQALQTVTWQDGARIVIELGVRATATNGAQIAVGKMYQGACRPGGLALPDGRANGTAHVSSSQGDAAAMVTFSAGLPLLDEPMTVHTNLTRDTAQEITLPFILPLTRTDDIPTSRRTLWFKWRATITGRIIFDTIGSNFDVLFDVFKGDETHTESTVFFWNVGLWLGMNENAGYADVLEGHTYTFVLYTFNVSGVATFRVGIRGTPQDDDLFVNAQHIAHFRWDGAQLNLININGDFFGNTPTGSAIDSSHRPVFDTNFDVNTNDRLLVALFTTGPLIELLNLDTLDQGPPDELNFYSDTLNPPLLSPHSVFAASVVFDNDGNFYTGYFGDAYSVLGDLSTPSTVRITKTPITAVDDSPDPVVASTAFDVAQDRGGSDYIDLTRDNSIIFYTSSGTKIKRITTAGVQLPDFATVPNAPGPRPGLRGLRLLPPGDGSGGLLVTNGSQVVRLDGAGNIVMTYTPANSVVAQDLDKVETTKDVSKFWVSDQFSTHMFLFDLNTGVEITDQTTNLPVGQLCGFTSKSGFRAGQAPPVIIPTTPITPTPTLVDSSSCCASPTMPLPQQRNLTTPGFNVSCVGGGSVPTHSDIQPIELWDY